MTWNHHYLPPDPTPWQGKKDAQPNAYFFQTIKLLNLLETWPDTAQQTTFAILGFRCDEGIQRHSGRLGTAEGPSAFRHALSKLPIQKQDFSVFDAGNIACHDGDLEAAQDALSKIVNMLLCHHIIPIVIGGGHDIAWGQYQGIYKTFPQKKLGILNFDSHFDMRPLLPNEKGSSGTPFLQIAQAHEAKNRPFDYNCIGIQHSANTRQSFETAKKYNAKMILAEELHNGSHEKCVDFIDRAIDQNEILYLTICLDVFGAPFAPGVSTTQPLGLFPWHVIPLLRQLAASGKTICYDIAELCPRYDIDQRTAKLAANLAYEIIHHHKSFNDAISGANPRT